MKDNTRYSNDIRYSIQLDNGEHAGSWEDFGGAADSITTSTTHVTGTHSISFAKVTGGTSATITKTLNRDKGIDINALVPNGSIKLSVYFSSIADIDSLYIALLEDSSNYVYYSVSDSSLGTGWNHITVDLIGATQVGTGVNWKNVKSVVVGPIFDSASDTLTGILLDHIYVENSDITVDIDTSSTLPVTVTNTPNVVVTNTPDVTVTNDGFTVSGTVDIGNTVTINDPVTVDGTVDIDNDVTVDSITSTVTVDGEVSIAEDPLDVYVTNDVGLRDAVSPGTTYSGTERAPLTMALRNDELLPRAGDSEYIPLMTDKNGALFTKILGDGVITRSQGNEYVNDIDFTVSHTSSSGVTITGLSYTPKTTDVLGVFAHTTGSGIRFYDPALYEFDYDSSTGVLNIGGDVFLGSGDSFRVVLQGPPRAYNAPVNAMQTVNVSPAWKYNGSYTLADVTNGSDTSATYYYLDVEDYKHLSLQLELNGGSGTISGTLEGTVQNDGTASSSCSYLDITNATFGVTAWSTSSSDTFIAVDDAGKIGGYKYVRVKIETYTGGADDSDWTIYSKLWY